MIQIKTTKLEMEKELKKKIEFICNFCHVKPIIKVGSIRAIENTNISYVEPHRIVIKGITYLAFNYESNIYVENLSRSIPIKDLEEYIKSSI